LPKVGQSVGQALRAFRDSTSSIEEEVKKSLGESTSDDESKE
ncbi:MAG: twin-arginine translocase TatA/TatE family subunit, partial [Actinobacteria bacterium]|nr:twin-arginine translocase TatA/TatE family subunit [Actinomycetota bacterium]